MFFLRSKEKSFFLQIYKEEALKQRDSFKRNTRLFERKNLKKNIPLLTKIFLLFEQPHLSFKKSDRFKKNTQGIRDTGDKEGFKKNLFLKRKQQGFKTNLFLKRKQQGCKKNKFVF